MRTTPEYPASPRGNKKTQEQWNKFKEYYYNYKAGKSHHGRTPKRPEGAPRACHVTGDEEENGKNDDDGVVHYHCTSRDQAVLHSSNRTRWRRLGPATHVETSFRELAYSLEQLLLTVSLFAGRFSFERDGEADPDGDARSEVGTVLL